MVTIIPSKQGWWEVTEALVPSGTVPSNYLRTGLASFHPLLGTPVSLLSSSPMPSPVVWNIRIVKMQIFGLFCVIKHHWTTVCVPQLLCAACLCDQRWWGVKWRAKLFLNPSCAFWGTWGAAQKAQILKIWGVRFSLTNPYWSVACVLGPGLERIVRKNGLKKAIEQVGLPVTQTLNTLSDRPRSVAGISWYHEHQRILLGWTCSPTLPRNPFSWTLLQS